MTSEYPTAVCAVPTSPRQGSSSADRRLLAVAIGLLFVSALPDAMVVPVLRQLLVERYAVSAGSAHAFMYFNLLGAIAVIGLVARLRRGRRTGRIIGLAALMNGLLLAIMALPIGFAATLLVRFVEGAADMIVFAFLFDIIARCGPSGSKGGRMGIAATALMLGIAIGIGTGGIIGGVYPLLSLWFGAAACFLVAPLALIFLTSADVPRDAHSPTPTTLANPLAGPLWPALVMMFSDRAVAGVMVSTVPLYLASHGHHGSAAIGGLIGIAMLMTALGAWPAGRLTDRIGYRRLRLVAGVMYAAGFSMLVVAPLLSTTLTVAIMIMFGAAGAALFSSSLMVVCQSGRGASGMAAYHVAGNLGFLFGPLTAGIVLSAWGDLTPGTGAFAGILIGFSLLHLVATAVTVIRVPDPAPLVSSARPRRKDFVSEFAGP